MVCAHCERDDDVLMPFLWEGLGLGHQCLVGLYEQDTRSILDALGTDADVEQAVTTDEFSIDNMIRFWEGIVSAAVRTGPFPFARFTAECTWWEKQLPGFDALAHYESALNKFAARYPLGFLCMYDMSEIDGGRRY
jgi:hypothetical protein